MLGEVLDVKKMIKTLKQAPFDDILVKYQSFFIWFEILRTNLFKMSLITAL